MLIVKFREKIDAYKNMKKLKECKGINLLNNENAYTIKLGGEK